MGALSKRDKQNSCMYVVLYKIHEEITSFLPKKYVQIKKNYIQLLFKEPICNNTILLTNNYKNEN